MRTRSPPTLIQLGRHLGNCRSAIGRYRFDGNEFDGFVDGITGDPQLATAETGEKSYALIANWIAAAVRFDARAVSKPA